MSAAVRVLAVAGNTLREAVRNRVLYTLVFFALGMIGLGVLLSTLSYVEQERILQDVGMAAIKVAAFGRAVNVTLGLPFIRTAPDHGTALDIAGKGTADASS